MIDTVGLEENVDQDGMTRVIGVWWIIDTDPQHSKLIIK